ncbi:MAG: hypothetical protein ACOCQA_01720, partial [bacterium]
EAMDILDVSRKTIYRRLKAGDLEGKKMINDGVKKWFISEDSIYTNKMITDSVDIEEVEKTITKEQLLNELVESISDQNKKDFKNLSDNIQQINQKLIEENQELIRENEKLKQQLDQLQKKLNKGFKEKLKELFKG